MRFFILLFILFFACGPVPSGKVEVPEIGNEFYVKALNSISKEYAKSPTQELLIQKLFYQEKLNWPEESIIDLKEAEKHFGLNKKVVEYYCDYYFNNRRYYELLGAVSVAKSLEDPDEQIRKYEIIGFAKTSGLQTTHPLLRDYLAIYTAPHAIEFGVQQYLELGDTLMAVYYLNKLQTVSPENPLMLDVLAPVLTSLGYNTQAKFVLSEFVKASPDEGFKVASGFLALGDLQSAKDIFRQVNSARSNLELATIYKNVRHYDSTVFYLDKVLAEDSSISVLLIKAAVMEERGWLTSAYSIYQFLIEKEPSDSVISSLSLNVERKIAYLRRLKEAQEFAPVLKIEPTKLTEDE